MKRKWIAAVFIGMLLQSYSCDEKKEQKQEKKVRIKEQDVLRDIQSKEKKAYPDEQSG